ncbi:MAG: GNAT family N-acetyltransferase [Ruminococcaceae bacterium]|nr:GNAT family N-acetyltransferase [Oscillospiraceae bacterium]
MIIRKTRVQDLPAVMPIFEEARASIAELGIDQWQDGYPAEADIRADIEAGESYCAVLDGEIVGCFALLFGGEPTYDVIEDGAWLTESDSANAKYAAIHRIAVKRARRGSGISTAIVNYAMEQAAANGKASVRVDTHHGNVVMRRMLEKHGFEACGTIYLASGHRRVGYERLV